MTMKNYLLEIGTEDLPVEFQTSAEDQLKEAISSRLTDERLSFDNIETYSTPRRMAVIVNGISDKQSDEVKEAKGPPANVAFKDGRPTPAAEGFAKRCNVPIDSLKLEKFGDTEYVVAQIEEKGKTCEEILQQAVPDIVLNLKGSYFMRWEDLDVRFSRPIRWLLSVIDDKSLPITVADVTSTIDSMGHRFLHPEAVSIPATGEYKNKLKEAYVVVDPAERKQKIKAQIYDLAKSKGGCILPNERLLNLVNNLVEWPVAIVGEFDKEYLEIPKEVITTVMESHQKYFPVYTPDGKELKNYFICVNNKNGAYAEKIIKGNQRVLKARLEDGAFYYNEDRKKSLASRIEELKGITFQKGLGNMHQKMQRIKMIASAICNQLKLSPKETQNALRAAELCKADLITFMVREFTELEGIIGRVYALKDNEDPEVAEGIGEHYLPRSVDDIIPRSMTGKVVALADKIDTIVSVFSIGKSPTGSADPLGLRRAALGVMMIILKSDLRLDISSLITVACESLKDIEKKSPADEVIPQVQEFITQRLKIYLNDQKYRYDAVDAVLSNKDPLADILDVVERLKVVQELVEEQNYSPFHETANRLLRILKGVDPSDSVNVALLTHESEKAFYEAFAYLNTDKLAYDRLVYKLKELTPVVEKFFDDVLVMDKEEAVKQNRLTLVHKADQKYKLLADFSKIVN